MTLAERIWARDPTVWVTDPAAPEVADRLGWLDAPETMTRHAEALADLAALGRGAGRVILAGMGGSSLAPEVLARAFGPRPGAPRLRLWDSTHPDAVPTLRDDDLIVVASKSGTTIETACFEAWAWEASGHAADRFVAVTDPGTALARRAAERGYRVFLNPPDVGGRYSALTLFGLVPAALLGLDVAGLLAAGRRAAEVCRREESEWETLGREVAGRALAGANRLAVTAPPPGEAFGLWLEQLVAESTGKAGRGVVPVSPDAADAGTVVREVAIREPLDLGGLFFGWSYATAVMGHVLGVNPFDQPDVEAAKARTRALLAGGGGAGVPSPDHAVGALLQGGGPGSYLAVLAFLPPSPEAERRLAGLRVALHRRTGRAVTTAFGPRYLHSTGQLHKGGPPTGRFLVIAPDAARDVAIPGQPHTFGALCAAQAAGDVEVLRALGRPVAVVPSLDLVEEAL